MYTYINKFIYFLKKKKIEKIKKLLQVKLKHFYMLKGFAYLRIVDFSKN